MGVNGLWTVIQPCARPTNLATLNRKRLAVDASIWIYQFLKAVRDKEGNALRNSHVVGFFRRICKLLWFGIRPVFVFDGGAPVLKRQTITGRKRRREGRREDAVRTAGKLLAVQMQRVAEEEGEKRRHRMELEIREPNAAAEADEAIEELPDADKLVYVDELGMDKQERQKSRKFYKQDAYHLPDLDAGLDNMGRPEDPRIMSVEELEEYARQFHSGEDINLYDFSKIDFEGEFFKSLPPADRYNILNAARMRSRLRMGLSKEQLDGMFPDRMAFSKFQIERVRERNHLTQRLMQEAGMTGTDLTLGINARIAGDKDREYILVKNDGAEGGWALGVVSREKDRGEMHKPIDVDAIDLQFQSKDEDLEWEDDDDFEDVPIEGINRLPKGNGRTISENVGFNNDEDDSLFVGGDVATNDVDRPFDAPSRDEQLFNDEEEDVNQAIALSMKNQHAVASPDQIEEEMFEEVPQPQWTQKAVEQSKPITSTRGNMIAHIVNNRANAAVPKPRARRESSPSSDGDVDLRAALSAARKKKAAPKSAPAPAPVTSNVKNPFSGPLPFEKLDWKSSIFAKRKEEPTAKAAQEGVVAEPQAENDLAGGFIADAEESEASRPLPPWMMENDSDIRDSMKAQRERDHEVDEADRAAALEEENQRRREAIIEIESSDSGEESDVQFIEAPIQNPPVPTAQSGQSPRLSPATLTRVSPPVGQDETEVEDSRRADTFQKLAHRDQRREDNADPRSPSVESTPDPDFEEVEILEPAMRPEQGNTKSPPNVESPAPVFEDVPVAETTEPDQVPQLGLTDPAPGDANDEIFGDGQFDDEFSDPEEEELLAQMAEEAEEHARFASQLNNKSERENQEAYERELKALRTQQKKDRRDADEVTQIMITECQALLRYFGIPYITAPMEAEAQCAELVSLGLVDGIVTDDSDIFLFGGTRVYKNMFNSNKFVECYLGSDLERELSLSREQLISIAHLLGSDYTEGLPGVGPVTAVEILSEFPGRDGLAEFKDWWQEVQVHNRPKEADQKSTFRRKFRKSQATKLFLPTGFPSPAVFDAYLHPEVDSAAEQFQWGVPDVEGLRQFLMATIGWSQERTDEVLVPVIRDMNRRDAEGTQSNITRYFEGGVGVGVGANNRANNNKEVFAPRQKTQGSKRMTAAVNKLRSRAAVVDDGGGMVDSSEVAAAEGDESMVPSISAGSGSAPQRKRKAQDKPSAADAAAADDDAGDEDFVDDGEAGGRDSGRKRAKTRGKRAKAST
ncbi:PIN domain-like protein [Xylariaceae sp. FL0804]|nr:PIN domain-like protein [Xylariaceae sp. FL0804]